MFCPKCGAQLPDDAGFCFKCGSKVGTAAPQQQGASPGQDVIAPMGAKSLKCPSCGAPISPKFGEMFVTGEFCGRRVSLGDQGW